MKDIEKIINTITINTTRDIEKKLIKYLNKCGLFYKIFGRIKNGKSAKNKISKKLTMNENYKLQDLIGYRIALYFKEDVEICEDIIKNSFEVVDISKDKEKVDIFSPIRINYVCKIPQDYMILFEKNIWEKPIDNTFEIQIRTIFSEGWHEIEHDFRYKNKKCWGENDDLSRVLNGVWATLENCDWAIASLLDKLAYREYKNKEWDSMIRNKLRIRVESTMETTYKFEKIFNENNNLAKSFYRFEKKNLMEMLVSLNKNIPLTIENIICLINELQINNEEIKKYTPKLISSSVKEYKESK